MAASAQKKRGRPSTWSEEELAFIEPFAAAYNGQTGSREAFFNGEGGFWVQWFAKFPSNEHRMTEQDVKKVCLLCLVSPVLSQFLLEASFVLPKPKNLQQLRGSWRS